MNILERAIRSIASTGSLFATLQGPTSDATRIEQIAAEWADYLLDGLDRSVADPLRSARGIYAGLGLDFTPDVETRMRRFLAANPRDRDGSHRYTFAATGLDEGELRERARSHQDHFDVPSEPLD